MEAEQLRRDALGELERGAGPDQPGTVRAIRGLAIVLGSSARLDEAAALYKRALAIDERAFGPASPEAARVQLALGDLFRRIGRFEEARAEINRARSAWESQGNGLAISSSLEQLALLVSSQGAPAEAVVHMERAVALAERAFGTDSPALAAIVAQTGRLYLLTGRVGAAERAAERVQRLIGHDPGDQTPGYLNLLQLQAEISAERGDLSAADARFRRAIAVAEKQGGAQAAAVGVIQFNLALAHLKAKQFQAAIEHFRSAIDVFKRESGARAPIVGYALMGAARAYAGNGDAATSSALNAAALEILGPAIAARRPEPKWL
jgi:tetratricopeptide (TPR) repeat protein